MIEQIKLLTLLEEKKQGLLQCEILTDKMCICPAEELESCVERRQTELDKMQTLDLQIQVIVDERRDLQDALQNSCERQGLSEELAMVFDTSLSLKAVANRILVCEDVVRERISIEQQKLMEKIESINTSSSSVAGKYSKSAMAGVARPLTAPRGKFI